MKQHILSQGILAVVGLSLIACQNKEIDFSTPQRDGPVFYASMEQVAEPDTRVYADENLMVLWHADDRVGIFNKYTYNQQYRFDGETGANSGTFSKVPSETFVTGNAIPAIYAVYPYAESTTITNDCKIQLTLPAEQAYSTLNFGPGANTMVSATEDNNLLFKNLGGYLAVKLYGDNVTVSKVTLRGNNGEKLAGVATVTAPLGGIPTVEMDEEAEEAVFLQCVTPVTLGPTPDEYTEFWFVIPPTTFTKGFTLTVASPAGDTFTKSTDKSISITRNHLSRMSPVEVNLPSWSGIPVPPDDEIWYITEDDTPIELYLDSGIEWFDAAIVSHQYEGGRGVIKCDGPIHVLNSGVFDAYRDDVCKITDLFLPDSVTTLDELAVYDINTRIFRVPKNLAALDAGYNEFLAGDPFMTGSLGLKSRYFERFEGENVTEDHRALILDGVMYAFAPRGMSSYSIPEGVTCLHSSLFQDCSELKSITFNEGLLQIGPECFSGVHFDPCDMVLPESLKYIMAYAFRCTGIRGFYGNERLHSPDHLFLYTPDDFTGLKVVIRFVGEDETEAVIEDGVYSIENYAFEDLPRLQSVTVPGSIDLMGGSAFHNCPNIKEIKGDGASEDHRAIMTNGVFHRLIVSSDLKQYTIPTGTRTIAVDALSGCHTLEEVSMDDQVEYIGGYAFGWCSKLKRVTLSARLKRIGYNRGGLIEPDYDPFQSTPSLEEIYFRSPVPPVYRSAQGRLNPGMKVYVPDQSLDLYKQSGWKVYADVMQGYHYEDLEEVYLSTDFSRDGNVVPLQTAAVGAGIDIVIVGDGFSDRQIADGTYSNAVDRVVDALFSEEPYHSFRDYFNVFAVDVVSWSEGYGQIGQALDTGFGSGTEVYGDDGKVMEYARKALPEAETFSNTIVIVLMNEDAYAGTCYMYFPEEGNYGCGLSIAYFPTSSDTETFNGLVSHEAGGHGFAKLADEYAYELMGAVPHDAIEAARIQEAWGWWKNIDFTDDPSQVKWSRFISDERYVSENIGCYEGGFTYWTGVWRPTENSIMRYNTGGFNAPSRYAIWYRINKLAYGESWEGTYEDFVAYDAVNRTPEASARRRARSAVQKPLPPLAPPVVVGHSWREAR